MLETQTLQQNSKAFHQPLKAIKVLVHIAYEGQYFKFVSPKGMETLKPTFAMLKSLKWSTTVSFFLVSFLNLQDLKGMKTLKPVVETLTRKKDAVQG